MKQTIAIMTDKPIEDEMQAMRLQMDNMNQIEQANKKWR
jgi:hypothetical protein